MRYNFSRVYSSIGHTIYRKYSRFASAMGKEYKEGASLRSWEHLMPNAQVIGADIDPDSLFNEGRIKCFQLDQASEKSFELFSNRVGDQFSLMVGDGLHSTSTQLRSLRFFIPRLAPRGYAVVEDISDNAIPVWKLVQGQLSRTLDSFIYRGKIANAFVVRASKTTNA